MQSSELSEEKRFNFNPRSALLFLRWSQNPILVEIVRNMCGLRYFEKLRNKSIRVFHLRRGGEHIG